MTYLLNDMVCYRSPDEMFQKYPQNLQHHYSHLPLRCTLLQHHILHLHIFQHPPVDVPSKQCILVYCKLLPYVTDHLLFKPFFSKGIADMHPQFPLKHMFLILCHPKMYVYSTLCL